jgi:hypothetical protein
VRIPRSVRDLQVGRKSLFFDFSSQRLFHGLDLFSGQWCQQFQDDAVMHLLKMILKATGKKGVPQGGVMCVVVFGRFA